MPSSWRTDSLRATVPTLQLRNCWKILASALIFLPTLAEAQTPLIDLRLTRGSGWSIGQFDNHPWPSLNFSQTTGPFSIAVSSGTSYAAASVEAHMRGDVSFGVGGADIYVYGKRGDHYRLNWGCVGSASGNNPTSSYVFYQGCGDYHTGPGGSGVFSHTQTSSGVIEGTLAGNSGGDLVWSAGNIIEMNGTGGETADWLYNFSVQIVRPNQQPPVAVIAPPVPSSPIAGTPVTLDGSGSYSSDGASLIEYKWTIQDPSAPNGTATQSGPTTQYTWQQDGTYNVTLTVTDSDGLTGTASTTVQVGSACPTSQRTSFARGLQNAQNPSCSCQNPISGLRPRPVAPEIRNYAAGYRFEIDLNPSGCVFQGVVLEEVTTDDAQTDCPIDLADRTVVKTGDIFFNGNDSFYSDSLLYRRTTAAQTTAGCTWIASQRITWINPVRGASPRSTILGTQTLRRTVSITGPTKTVTSCMDQTCGVPVPIQ